MDPGGGGPVRATCCKTSTWGYYVGWWRGGRKKENERITALEKAVEAQDSRIRLLKNEWEDVLDRANRVMGRLNARIRKFTKEDASEEATETTETPAEGLRAVPGSHAVLSGMRGKRGVLPR